MTDQLRRLAAAAVGFGQNTLAGSDEPQLPQHQELQPSKQFPLARLPVFWQADDGVWVSTDHDPSPIENAEGRVNHVWRPLAHAGAATKVYATQTIIHERSGLEPMKPSHPAAPVTTVDGNGYYQSFVLQECDQQAAYLLSFPLTSVPPEVVRRLRVTVQQGAATVGADVTLFARSAAGQPDLAAPPHVWRLFGRCELPADADTSAARVFCRQTQRLARGRGGAGPPAGRVTWQLWLVVALPRLSSKQDLAAALRGRAQARAKRVARPLLTARTSTRDAKPYISHEDFTPGCLGGCLGLCERAAGGLHECGEDGKAIVVGGAAHSGRAVRGFWGDLHDWLMSDWHSEVEAEETSGAEPKKDSYTEGPVNQIVDTVTLGEGSKPLPINKRNAARLSTGLQSTQSFLERAPAGTVRQSTFRRSENLEGTTANW